MSRVTNIILCGMIWDDEIKDVNAWLEARLPPCGVLEPVSYADVGGTKCLEADVFIAAFNFFDFYAFAKELSKVAWRVGPPLLLVMEQEDDTFRKIDYGDWV